MFLPRGFTYRNFPMDMLAAFGFVASQRDLIMCQHTAMTSDSSHRLLPALTRKGASLRVKWA